MNKCYDKPQCKLCAGKGTFGGSQCPDTSHTSIKVPSDEGVKAKQRAQRADRKPRSR